jgi:hypothetical protein
MRAYIDAKPIFSAKAVDSTYRLEYQSSDAVSYEDDGSILDLGPGGNQTRALWRASTYTVDFTVGSYGCNRK